MLYIYMLGYDVDFGHMETVALISAPKYAEKQVLFLSFQLLQSVLGTRQESGTIEWTFFSFAGR